MPELTLQIKSAADLTAFKQAQAAADSLNASVKGPDASGAAKGLKEVTSGLKNASKDLHSTNVKAAELRTAFAGLGQGLQLGGSTGQVLGLATAFSVLNKAIGSVSIRAQMGNLKSIIKERVTRTYDGQEKRTYPEFASIMMGNINRATALRFRRTQLPSFGMMPAEGAGLSHTVMGAGIVAGLLAVTKLGTTISRMSEEGTPVWEQAKNAFTDLGTKFNNWMSGAGDIVDELNATTVQNIKRQAETGTSNKARNAALLELDLKLIDPNLTDETKAEVRKQIEQIKSGRAAEKFYGVSTAPLFEGRKDATQIKNGEVMFRNIGMEQMEANYKAATKALNEALDSGNVALVAERQVNMAKQENLMEGAKIAKEEARLAQESADSRKVLLSRVRQNFDDGQKQKEKEKIESDDNKKLLLDRVRRNFEGNKPTIDRAAPYSDDMRRVGLIMGGNPSAQVSIANSSRETARNTAQMARSMSQQNLSRPNADAGALQPSFSF